MVDDSDGFVDGSLSLEGHSDTWIDIPIEYEFGTCVSMAIRYALGHDDGLMMQLSFGDEVIPIDFESTGSWDSFSYTTNQIKVDTFEHDSMRLSTVQDLDGPNFDSFELTPCPDAAIELPTPQPNRGGY